MREVPTEEAKQFCEEHKLFFIETSALSDSNVSKAFETILKGDFSSLGHGNTHSITEIFRLISQKSVTAESQAYVHTGQGESIVISEDHSGAEESGGGKLKCCQS